MPSSSGAAGPPDTPASTTAKLIESFDLSKEDRAELPEWAVGDEYELGERLGTGSYGDVVKATHRPTGDDVAIKRVFDVFQHERDARCILREVRILRTLRHSNIIQLRDVILPANLENFRDVYLVFEFLPTDLHQVFHSQTYLTGDHIRWLLLDMLRALKYLHSAQIIHRDIKPANWVLNLQPVAMKLCDFGLARSLKGLHQPTGPAKRGQPSQATPNRPMQRSLTKHVVTRWYRPPEIIFCDSRYTFEVDLWSIGCIFAEMLGMMRENCPDYRDRRPLFPGSSCFPLSPGDRGENVMPQDFSDQLNIIVRVLGTMDDDDIESVQSAEARRFLREMKPTKGTPLEDLFPGSEPEALDLLQRLLQMNPKKRATIDQALDHPYLSAVRHHPAAGPDIIADGPCELEFDTQTHMSLDELRNLLRREILFFHPAAQDNGTSSPSKRHRPAEKRQILQQRPQKTPRSTPMD